MTGWVLVFIMGVVLGLIGGGGGILTVPILVYSFSIAPETAATNSLFIVGVSALIGSLAYFRNGLVRIPIGLGFAAPGVLMTGLVRRYFLPSVPEIPFQLGTLHVTKSFLLMMFFSVVMFFSALSMIKGQVRKKNISPLQVPITGGIVGIVSGIVGAGGGFLIVPALSNGLGLEMKEAVGTSLMIISFNSLLGFFLSPNLEVGVEWKFLGLFSCVAILGILLGGQLNKKVPSAKLKTGFGYFVLLMGIMITLEQLVRFLS